MAQLPLLDPKKYFRPHPMVENMQRLRMRLERLKETLQHLGYIFESPNEVIGSPDPHLNDKLDFLTKEFGYIPQSLKQFYATIGSVNFLGSHPDWDGCDDPAPLFVYEIGKSISEIEEWRRCAVDAEENDGWPPYAIVISPSSHIPLPIDCSTPLLVSEHHHTTFYGYLTTALKWGGFLGLAKVENHTWPMEELRKATVWNEKVKTSNEKL